MLAALSHQLPGPLACLPHGLASQCLSVLLHLHTYRHGCLASALTQHSRATSFTTCADSLPHAMRFSSTLATLILPTYDARFHIKLAITMLLAQNSRCTYAALAAGARRQHSPPRGRLGHLADGQSPSRCRGARRPPCR